MLEAIKSLLDSGILTEENKQQIETAWHSKLEEAKSDLRSEFANRYEHDKTVMVEALDRMVTESLTEEIKKISDEKAQLIADRTKFVAEMSNKAKNFETFLKESLTKEVREFASDRKNQKAVIGKMEQFVMRALAEELTEFADDKKDLIATKVKLVSEAKSKIDALRKDFVARSSSLVEAAVAKTLRAELGQLKEDIKVSRENNFGRRIYEAFASEFSATHLNENAAVRKLTAKVGEMEKALEEASVASASNAELVESKNQEIKKINDRILRETKLNSLLKNLAADKSAVMKNLLENVQTDKLDYAFTKYLPAVTDARQDRKVINETVANKEVTGNRVARAPISSVESSDNIIDMKRLAGLK